VFKAIGQSLAGAAGTAFHRSDRNPHHLRGFLAGEAGSSHQDQHLAVFRAQQVKCPLEVLQGQSPIMGRLDGQGRGMNAIGVLHFAPGLAERRIERVAQDREKPGIQVRRGMNLSMFDQAFRMVSCTRSSARLTSPTAHREAETAKAHRG